MPVLTRQQLRNFSPFIKDVFGVNSLNHINLDYLMEVLIPKKLDNLFVVTCVDIAEWHYSCFKKAVCDINNHAIEIRSDVYSRLTNNKPVRAIRKALRSYLLWQYYFCIRKKEDCIMKNRKNSSY